MAPMASKTTLPSAWLVTSLVYILFVFQNWYGCFLPKILSGILPFFTIKGYTQVIMGTLFSIRLFIGDMVASIIASIMFFGSISL